MGNEGKESEIGRLVKERKTEIWWLSNSSEVVLLSVKLLGVKQKEPMILEAAKVYEYSNHSKFKTFTAI
jgi:hypothetical protein